MKKHYSKDQRFSYRTSQKSKHCYVLNFILGDAEIILRHWNDDLLEQQEQFKIVLLNVVVKMELKRGSKKSLQIMHTIILRNISSESILKMNLKKPCQLSGVTKNYRKLG
jgi:hypothetical protein